MPKKPIPNIETGITVFIFLHSEDWRDCLQRWLGAHPRASRIEKGKGVNKSVTMAVSSWRRFCAYYHFSFKDI